MTRTSRTREKKTVETHTHTHKLIDHHLSGVGCLSKFFEKDGQDDVMEKILQLSAKNGGKKEKNPNQLPKKNKHTQAN